MLHCNMRSDGRGLRASVGREHRHSPAPYVEPTGMGAFQAARADTASAGGVAAALGVAGDEPHVGRLGTGAADRKGEAVGQGGGVLGPPAGAQAAQNTRHGREEGGRQRRHRTALQTLTAWLLGSERKLLFCQEAPGYIRVCKSKTVRKESKKIIPYIQILLSIESSTLGY